MRVITYGTSELCDEDHVRLLQGAKALGDHPKRTEGVSSTILRAANHGILKLGVMVSRSISKRFPNESYFVSEVHGQGVFGRRWTEAEVSRGQHNPKCVPREFDELRRAVSAVYIASPHEHHVDYVPRTCSADEHVLCEKLCALSAADTQRLHKTADRHDVVALEAIKTACSPRFQHLAAIARSGSVGGHHIEETKTNKVEIQ